MILQDHEKMKTVEEHVEKLQRMKQNIMQELAGNKKQKHTRMATTTPSPAFLAAKAKEEQQEKRAHAFERRLTRWIRKRRTPSSEGAWCRPRGVCLGRHPFS